ncbi:MAG: hypothetical protein HY791_01400 [Deltaproteobacteria bacterium]|nr:hypothetical protein [Deltaproteobacteria bacterium]
MSSILSSATRDVRLRQFLALGASIGLISGCSDEEVALSDFSPRLACSTDADCPLGFECGFNSCGEKARPENLTSAYVEIIPPAGVPYARSQLISAIGAASTIVLPEAQVFERVIVLNAVGESIAARVTVAGDGRLPGLEIEPSVLVLPELPGRLTLSPGRYRAHVVPLDPSTPGMLVRQWDVSSSGPRLEKQFILPGEFPRLEGEVTSRASREQKRAGVRVRAYAVESGLASTEAVSDELGRFEIVLPKTDETTFLVKAAPRDAAGPTWGYEQVVVLAEGDERRLDIPLDDSLPETRGAVRLRVLGLGANGPEPVLGARVTLTASIAPEFKVLRVEGTTSNDGTVVSPETDELVEVLAARYLIEVRTSLRSEFRSANELVNLSSVHSDMIADAQVLLAKRVLVESRVLRGGQAIADAQVELESEAGDVLSDHTAADGGLRLALDPGRWRMKIFGDGLPIELRVVEVPDVESTVLDPVELARPIEFGGVIVGGRGEPISGATIGVYAVVEGRTAILGQARSADGGAFRMLLADRAP